MSPPSHNFTAPKIMVFRPTLEEMKDFPAFITYMESKGAHKAGIAKIIPPKDFVAAYDYEKAHSITIPAPIQQEVMGHQGIYTQYNIQKKPLTFQEFRKLANSSRYATPPHFDYDDLERKYWKNITYNPPIYAADISGSLYSKGCDIWNINKLNTLLDVIEEEQGVKIEGVNTAYLYFGMWKTTFAWHTEDMDLYSINYLHFGAPKSWYGIPPEHAKRLERLAAGFFPQSFQICPNFLRHKMTLISPQILRKYSIPYDKITQETGEFMVTFPYGYHAGYNHGFNCAESTNFASLRWIDFGKRAKCCSCQRDSVKINMDPFVRIFQPDRYEVWKQGKDVVFIEDIYKPSSHGSGMQSHAHAIVENHGPGKDSEIPLKTRRQPLHKKDGRRVKAGTTSQRKRTHKPEDEEKEVMSVMEQNPAVVPVVKVEIHSAETTLGVTEPDGLKTLSSLLPAGQPKLEQDKDEPAPKVPRLEDPPATGSSNSEDSTHKVKRKKAKLEKGNLKSKNRHRRQELGLDVQDMVANGRPSKSQKSNRTSHRSQEKECSKDKRVKKALVHKSHEKTVNMKQYHSDSELSVPNSNDSLLKPKANTSQLKQNGRSPKTGLLLEKEEAKKRRKVKAKKVILRKWRDGVKRDHDYSSSTDNTEDPLTMNKAKRRTMKSDKLVKKSLKVKSNKLADKQQADHTEDRSANSAKFVEVNETQQETEQDLNAVSKAKTTSQRKPSTSTNGQAARNSRPRGNAKHDFTPQEFATMKSWARSMNGLWVTQPHSYEMELAYNLSIADQRPGCCICMLFYNEKIDGNKWDKKEQKGPDGSGCSIDQRTVVLTPEMCFAVTSEDQSPECVNGDLSPEGCSKLLNCNQCKIVVHASCYGESSITSEPWKCRRCQEQDYLAECCLCNLRGGALKRTTNGRWAHIICAMAIPEVVFENVRAREPINIDKISPARLKLKCFFCRPFIKIGNKFGGLIQCSVGRCALAFHVTCAQAAGVIMEPCDWPYAVYATCLRHPYSDKMRDDPREYPLKDVSVGETVIAKHKNSRYYKSEVIGEHHQDFYHVKFDDGSFSDNLYPYDIESRDCRHDGPPQEGTAVTVRWTDGLLYKGAFVRNYSAKMYDVEFEDGSTSRVKREDVFYEDESLPKRVLTKLSTASDMRHENFLDNEVVTERHRHVYSLYASSASSEAEEKAPSGTKHSKAKTITVDSTEIVSTAEHRHLLPQEMKGDEVSGVTAQSAEIVSAAEHARNTSSHLLPQEMKDDEVGGVAVNLSEIVSTAKCTGNTCTADSCPLPMEMKHDESSKITAVSDKIHSMTPNISQATDSSVLPQARKEYMAGNEEWP